MSDPLRTQKGLKVDLEDLEIEPHTEHNEAINKVQTQQTTNLVQKTYRS